MADNKGDSVDLDLKPSACKKVNTSYGDASECLVHCAGAKNWAKLHSPESMKSWHELLNAAGIRRHHPILDIAENVQADADLKQVRYHRQCHSIFTMKSTLEELEKIIQDTERSEDQSVGDDGKLPILSGSACGLSLEFLEASCIICDEATRYKPSTNIAEKLMKCTRKGHVRLSEVAGLKNDSRLMKLLSSTNNVAAKELQFHPSCYKNYSRSRSNHFYSSEEGALADVEFTRIMCNLSEAEDGTFNNGTVVGTEQEINPDYVPSPFKRVKTSEIVSSEYLTDSSGTQNHDNLNSPVSTNVETKSCIICNRVVKKIPSRNVDEKLVHCKRKGHARLIQLAEEKSDTRLMKLLMSVTAKETQFHPSCYKNYNRSNRNLYRLSEKGALTDVEFPLSICDVSGGENISNNVELFPQSSTQDSLSAKNKTDTVNMPFNKHLEIMATMLLQYRADHFLCDVLVMVDGGELQAHSVILSAASPVFKAAFTVPSIPHCVQVSNVNMDVMKLALDAIYTGRIECEDSKRLAVKQLLVSLDVDINRMEECEIAKIDMKRIVKRENDRMVATNTESVCFNSVEDLKRYTADIADTSTDKLTGRTDAVENSQLDQINIKRRQKLCETASVQFDAKQSDIEQGHSGDGSADDSNSEQFLQSIVRVQYDCIYCSNSFTSPLELRKHKKSQHRDNDDKHEHVCDVCRKSFKSRSALKVHRDIIHKGKVHLCQLCGKTFNRSSNLVEHAASHSRENIGREFECNLCPAKFKRRLILIEHKERVHGVIEPRVTVFCDKCGKRLGSRKVIRRHQRFSCRERNKTDLTLLESAELRNKVSY